LRILFCSQTSLSRERGGSKVVIELAEEMRRLGWTCELVSPDDLAPDTLHSYLRGHAGAFDVVDYDHNHLPYPRTSFPQRCLFVARSVLLAHHFARIPVPPPPGLKSGLRSLLLQRREDAQRRIRIARAHITVVEADLVNVANSDDKSELVRCGVSADKIVVIPYGIGRDRRALFDAVSAAAPASPLIGFIGTFEGRKGATDMPAIVRSVCEAISEARFRLMGTLMDGDRILRAMPRRLRSRIEVYSRYAPEDLPMLLAPCSVGIFPSYIEAFGFGVLEMLAACVPVVAYDSPGPSMMLPPEWLVPRGDVSAMSSLVVGLLRDQHKLQHARREARELSRAFDWPSIAQTTAETYQTHWKRRNA
jgi:glycosyltransferase involved in cell wall biosynthesis